MPRHLLLTSGLSASPAANPIPHLRKQGAATQLPVNKRPLVMLAGELHNSSSSSLEYMKAIWPRLVKREDPNHPVMVVIGGQYADIQLPAKAGQYRLFVYARDGRGNATTANLPLLTAIQPNP
jgi:hypothetical protein